MALKGACLCGGVRYEADADPVAAGHCHCTRCQRSSGSGSATGVVVPRGTVRIVDGEDLTHTFAEEGHTARLFCTNCGSQLFGIHGDMAILSAGALDSSAAIMPQFHMMVAYKAPWDVIGDDLPQFAEFPPMDEH